MSAIDNTSPGRPTNDVDRLIANYAAPIGDRLKQQILDRMASERTAYERQQQAQRDQSRHKEFER